MDNRPQDPPTQPPPSTDPLPASWHLTPAQHADILHTQIIPTELGPYLPVPPATTSKKSQAILILGQTGAGKTRFTPSLLAPLDNPLHLIADTFKTYHPFYAACRTLTPSISLARLDAVVFIVAYEVPNTIVVSSPTHARHASRLAGPPATAWLLSLSHHAAHVLRLPCVVIEAACRRQPDLPALAGVFLSAGYAVRVVVLAVPAALSRLGVLVRFWGRLPEAGSRGLPGRLTPRGVHDESFGGVGLGVGWVDEICRGGDGAEGSGKGEVDKVAVLRRNGVAVYLNERLEGGWTKEVGALGALERERGRALSAEERRAAEVDVEMLRGLGNPKVDAEIEEIEALMAGLGTEDGEAGGSVPFDAVEFVSVS